MQRTVTFFQALKECFGFWKYLQNNKKHGFQKLGGVVSTRKPC